MKRCAQCGQDEHWCSVYTGCPLNKGLGHRLTVRCITVKGKEYRHQFVYDGAGPGKHCLFCGMKEGS